MIFVNNLKNFLFKHKITCSSGSLLCLYIANRSLCTLVASLISGFGLSILFVSIFVYKKNEINEDEYVDTEYIKYLKFINKDYDTFIDIYENNKEDEFYSSESFLKNLNNVANHKTYDLPLDYNKMIIFFYNFEESSYYYYSKCNVDNKILNSICRTYVIENKCLNIFMEEEEIKYIKNECKMPEDVSSNIEDISSNTEDISSNCKIELKETESKEYINVFYNKNKKKIKKLKPDYKTNKYIYKGTIDEYNKKYINVKKSSNQINYSDYINKFK